MKFHQYLVALPLLAVACQGLGPLDKLVDSGTSGPADTDETDIVQLGDLRIEPGTVAFGVVGLGEVASQSVVLSNTGEDDLIVRQATLDGDAQFTVSTSTGLPIQMGAGEDLIVDVAFSPDAAENYSAGLSLDVNSLDEPYVIEVTGAGEGAIIDTGDTDTDPPAGELVAEPTSLNFEDVPTNQAGARDVVLTNNHTDNILIQQIVGTPSEFGYRPGGEITLPQVISPGESRTVTLTFDPANETPYSGEVTFTLDIAGTAGQLQIPVQGVGVEPPCDICAPIVTVSPNPIDIRTLFCSASETVSVTNVGDMDLEISNIYISNDSLTTCGSFSLRSGTTTTASLTPGGTTTFEVDYDATGPCLENANPSRDANILHITNNSGQPDYTVNLQAGTTCPNP